MIIGVFIGIQVANWNEQRLERHETQRMLTRLKPELRNLLDLYASARTYYATTRDYAATAFAGWRSDPKVSDRDFVIAAYQAQIDTEAVNTPYRQNVRRVIPVELQDAIRAECGDRRPADNLQLWFLPKSCDLDVPPAAAATAAAALRAHPQLVDDLRWHTAAAAAFLNNIDTFEKKTRMLKEQIDSLEYPKQRGGRRVPPMSATGRTWSSASDSERPTAACRSTRRPCGRNNLCAD